MATTLLSISYVFILGLGFLDLVYKSSTSRSLAQYCDRGAHSYIILFLSILNFILSHFQAISPNLMAAKISRYTVRICFGNNLTNGGCVTIALQTSNSILRAWLKCYLRAYNYLAITSTANIVLPWQCLLPQ